MSETLEALRGEIDELNHQILELFNERARCALAIALHKRASGIPIRDRQREAELIERLVRQNRGPFDDDEVRTLFLGIIEASVRLMGGEVRAPNRQRGDKTCDSALRAISTRL